MRRAVLSAVLASAAMLAASTGPAASSIAHDVSRIQVLHANWTTFAFPFVPGQTYQFINLDTVQGRTQTGSSFTEDNRVNLLINVCVADSTTSCGSAPGSWGFIGGGSADGVRIAGDLRSGSIDATVAGYRCDYSGCTWTSLDVDGTFTASGSTVRTADTDAVNPAPGVRSWCGATRL